MPTNPDSEERSVPSTQPTSGSTTASTPPASGSPTAPAPGSTTTPTPPASGSPTAPAPGSTTTPTPPASGSPTAPTPPTSGGSSTTSTPSVATPQPRTDQNFAAPSTDKVLDPASSRRTGWESYSGAMSDANKQRIQTERAAYIDWFKRRYGREPSYYGKADPSTSNPAGATSRGANPTGTVSNSRTNQHVNGNIIASESWAAAGGEGRDAFDAAKYANSVASINKYFADAGRGEKLRGLMAGAEGLFKEDGSIDWNNVKTYDQYLMLLGKARHVQNGVRADQENQKRTALQEAEERNKILNGLHDRGIQVESHKDGKSLYNIDQLRDMYQQAKVGDVRNALKELREYDMLNQLSADARLWYNGETSKTPKADLNTPRRQQLVTDLWRKSTAAGIKTRDMFQDDIPQDERGRAMPQVYEDDRESVLDRAARSRKAPTAKAPTAKAPTAEASTTTAPTATTSTAGTPTAGAPTAGAPTAGAPTVEAPVNATLAALRTVGGIVTEPARRAGEGLVAPLTARARTPARSAQSRRVTPPRNPRK